MAGKIKVPSELVPSQSNKILLRNKYIYDDVKGHTQEEINQALEEQIEDKVIEAGGVNWDTVPTAGSNNAVKSKDIKAALEKTTGYFVLDSNVTESTVAKTVTVADFPALAIGGSIKVKMLTKNTATNPTLKIGPQSATAYPIYYNGSPASADNSWEANEVISVYFDGTNYQTSNTQGGGTRLEVELAHILDNHERRIRETENNKLGEDEELVIARALQESQGSGGGESSLSGSVTIANSDNIIVLGSSFGDGSNLEYREKNWVNIVSMFSDYLYQNASMNQTSSVQRMNKLLSGSVVPRKGTRYAMVVNNENCLVDQAHLLKMQDHLCKVLLSLGITPIIGTSYRNYLSNEQENMYVSSIYRDYCEKNNYIFMDAAAPWQLLRGGAYSFNNGGSHLSVRCIPTVAYAYMDALRGMERPVKSIKIFLPRETVVDKDSLVFNSNTDRAKYFKECSLGDYGNSTLTFPRGYALISAVLPCDQIGTKTISLEIETSTDVKVYVRNTRSRYPAMPLECTRFHVNEEVELPQDLDEMLNTTYSFNSKTFTVKHVTLRADGSQGTFCDIYCTDDIGTTKYEEGGTLTRISGTGPASIPFIFAGGNATFTPLTETIDAFTGGKWVEITPTEGKYSLINLYGIMDIDKVDFLVQSVNENSFNIVTNSIKVNWEARELKTNYRRYVTKEFESNYISTETELLPEPTFGAEGTTQSTWKDGQGNYLVSEANYEKTVKGKSGVYPMDATSIIKVSDSISMNYTIPVSSHKLDPWGKIVIEVVARNFGVNYSDVTNESWDFNTLIVGFGGTQGNPGAPWRKWTEMTELVGLFWKICRFTVDITHSKPSDYQQFPLKIWAEKPGMEIARVSIKYKYKN